MAMVSAAINFWFATSMFFKRLSHISFSQFTRKYIFERLFSVSIRSATGYFSDEIITIHLILLCDVFCFNLKSYEWITREHLFTRIKNEHKWTFDWFIFMIKSHFTIQQQRVNHRIHEIGKRWHEENQKITSN